MAAGPGSCSRGDLMKIMRTISKIHSGMPTRARGTLATGPQSGSVIQTALEYAMAWTKPEFVDFRFGFEITMYVLTR
jgi:coenzyme PQQ precursor peptide PqqA